MRPRLIDVAVAAGFDSEFAADAAAGPGEDTDVDALGDDTRVDVACAANVPHSTPSDDTRVDVACAANVPHSTPSDDCERIELRAAVRALRERLDERAREVHVAAERICELEQQVDASEARARALEARVAGAEQRAAALRDDLAAARATIESLRDHARAIAALHERQLREQEARAAGAVAALFVLFSHTLR